VKKGKKDGGTEEKGRRGEGGNGRRGEWEKGGMGD